MVVSTIISKVMPRTIGRIDCAKASANGALYSYFLLPTGPQVKLVNLWRPCFLVYNFYSKSLKKISLNCLIAISVSSRIVHCNVDGLSLFSQSMLIPPHPNLSFFYRNGELQFLFTEGCRKLHVLLVRYLNGCLLLLYSS